MPSDDTIPDPEDESAVWLDDDPAFIERLAREAQLEGETIDEFVEKSVRQRADSDS